MHTSSGRLGMKTLIEMIEQSDLAKRGAIR